MKCANCGKAEATSVWDSLVFEQNVSTGFVSEWATGYEKAGLCPACRQELARKNAAVLFPRKHQVLWILAGVLGAAGAALGVTSTLVDEALIHANDIAVFTAMCMCWSGYLSTHTSMMDSLDCKELIGKAILCHTIGGLCAGVAAHWLFVLFSAIL